MAVSKNPFDNPDAVRTGADGVNLNVRIPKEVDRLLFALEGDRRLHPTHPIKSRSQACLVALVYGLKAMGYADTNASAGEIMAPSMLAPPAPRPTHSEHIAEARSACQAAKQVLAALE